MLFLYSNSMDDSRASGFSDSWRSNLLWEVAAPLNYHLGLDTPAASTASRVSITAADPDRGWSVRAAPVAVLPSGTTRFAYGWEHERCRIWQRTEAGLQERR